MPGLRASLQKACVHGLLLNPQSCCHAILVSEHAAASLLIHRSPFKPSRTSLRLVIVALGVQLYCQMLMSLERSTT